MKTKHGSIHSSYIFFSNADIAIVAGNATYKSPSPSVGWSVGHAFTFSMRMTFIAPAKLIIAPAQVITAPAQLITAPAQPPATRAAVYKALLLMKTPNFSCLESIRGLC